MIGIHDMGGMHGFGPVDTVDEQTFHADWEGLTFALEKLCAHHGVWLTSDEVRHSIEKIGHGLYLTGTYYEHWLHAWEPLLIEKGFVTERELRDRQQAVRDGVEIRIQEPPSTQDEGDALSRAILSTIYDGVRADRELPAPPRFAVGDRVVALPRPVPTHTRSPRYIWGHTGTVAISHGAFILPDAISQHLGENPEYVYAVSFDGDVLWDDQAEPGTEFIVDLWESYLAPAAGINE
ncbi:nitrile hydratase subunit beta [Aeromicrobium sp. CFBP 8757]|uniref:nitrile hydratase subunit beta n=1 Tax=Aeromicrobium sp. CFBP 8757 TaxID=2775288 RepID=UPI001780DC99|nr:nitrile hydratase subunit beta [Aeromicrobium sp. CFBP 8757]MBD8605396.1 nitrile hydratase subunit beta [Aeromicrobium sp. CFBP 8757]